jgi:alpha-ketoglutaric semialdehyde dehydrogenase
MVRVNRPTVGAAFNAPFGESSSRARAPTRSSSDPTVMDFYTVSRTVWLGS